MEQTHQEVLLYEVRKTFDLVDNYSERLLLRVKSYLYINFFLFTSFIVLFRLMESQMNYFILSLFVLLFINFLISFVNIIIILEFQWLDLNPNSKYHLDKRIYNKKEFYIKIIDSYEEAIEFNKEQAYRRKRLANFVFMAIFLSVSLLTLLSIIYIIKNGI